MPPLSLVRAFVTQWWTAGVVFLYLSLKTVYQGLQPSSVHDPHLILIGGVEALASLLFLIPRTLRIGAVGLLVIFIAVWLIHALRVELRGDL